MSFDPPPIREPIYVGNVFSKVWARWFQKMHSNLGGSGGVIPATSGGTGLSSFTIGDLFYANTTMTIGKLNGVATGNVLLSGGVGTAPSWGQVGLTTHVSGRLPYANFTQGSALSVLGVTGNAAADQASIAAGSDHQVLRRSGTSVGFGQVSLEQSAAVTGALPVTNGGTGLAVASGGALQGFILRITNNGGTIQHSIVAENSTGAAGNFSTKINGASATFQNTPTGADGSTAFTTGVKISSATAANLFFDTADQTVADALGVATIALNDTGTAINVIVGRVSIDINGVTRTRLRFRFTQDAAGGAGYGLTGMGVGTSIYVQFLGVIQ